MTWMMPSQRCYAGLTNNSSVTLQSDHSIANRSMGVPMKLSFSDIGNSQTYQVAAAAQSKANIFVATAVAIFIMVFSHWGFGLWWFVIIPCLWFAASLFVAMPFMVLKVATVASLSETFDRARLASGIIDTLNYVVLVLATYFGLWYLHGLIGFHGGKEQAWIVFEFTMPDGKPAQMTFINPNFPNITLSECQTALPDAQKELLKRAMNQPVLAKAKFRSAKCVMSVTDPIKPN